MSDTQLLDCRESPFFSLLNLNIKKRMATKLWSTCMLGIAALSCMAGRPAVGVSFAPPITHVLTFLKVGRKHVPQSKKQFFSKSTIGVAAAVAVENKE